MRVYCDISYYEIEKVLGWAYYALDDKGEPVFRFPRTGARFIKVKKCWETEVKKLIVRQYPEAEIMTDHVDGPLGGTKVERHDPMLLICHYAAKQAALAKIRRSHRNGN